MSSLDELKAAHLYERQRMKMVEDQIHQRGIKDQRILQAMQKLPRHLFVPSEEKDRAYDDGPLPIGFGQTISQPYIVAYMTDILHLLPHHKVLEIGTGCGYQTAVLAEIVKEVYSIEIVETLAVSTEKRLTDLGYANVHLKQGDGFAGWPEFLPFNAIIVTAAPMEIPSALIAQLAEGGRMVIPLGEFEQELYLIEKTAAGVSQKFLMPVRFVPMIKKT